MGGTKIRRLCVFCGSQNGKREVYRQQAVALGRALTENSITLIYGGGSIGLMGVLAETMLDGGGKVIGVIPGRLARTELMHEGLTELHVVDTMHERKALMSDLADAFVALPGGFGTFEEVLEVITWVQLGILSKPVGFLDVDGYYDDLLRMVDRGIEEGFIDSQYRELFLTETRAEALLDRLMTYRPLPSILKKLGLENR